MLQQVLVLHFSFEMNFEFRNSWIFTESLKASGEASHAHQTQASALCTIVVSPRVPVVKPFPTLISFGDLGGF